MLHEGERLVKPMDIIKQIPVEKFEAIAILGLGRIGEPSEVYLSTMTINELCFLSQQLQAHLACRLGPMIEGG